MTDSMEHSSDDATPAKDEDVPFGANLNPEPSASENEPDQDVESQTPDERSELPEPVEAPKDEAADFSDDTSDTDGITESLAPVASTKPRLPDWSNERSGHRIAVELKHIEAEVRQLLENSDTRRKRRLGGSRRWQELQEDILAWRFSGRPSEEAIANLTALVAKRNQLYDRIVFLSTIRPGWREQTAAKK